MSEKVVLRNRIEWRNKDGLAHRLDGPAIEWGNGTREWHINGKRHRLDGPAVKYLSGDSFWYQNGRLHRLDGPAAEYDNGFLRWCINGNQFLSEEEWFNALIEDDQIAYLFKNKG